MKVMLFIKSVYCFSESIQDGADKLFSILTFTENMQFQSL